LHFKIVADECVDFLKTSDTLCNMFILNSLLTYSYNIKEINNVSKLISELNRGHTFIENTFINCLCLCEYVKCHHFFR